MKPILLILGMAVMLSGCSGMNWGITEKFTETNQMIADANNNRLKEFAAGMAACRDNAACQVGVSMAFSGNMGQQQFFKPETVKDYLVAVMPYATLGVDVFRLWNGAGGSQGVVVNGKGNTVIGVGNKSTADNGATLSANANPYIYTTNSTVTQDHTTSGGPVNTSGTAPASEVVQVEPFIVEGPPAPAPAPVP